MKELIPHIKRISEKIREAETNRRRLAEFLLKNDFHVELVRKLKPDVLDKTKIAGVDGGIVKKSLHGFDCMLVRAVGVCFEYENGRIKNVSYFPGRLPSPEAHVIEALSDLDWAYCSSIRRQAAEIKTATACMEKFRPDFLLLDGLVVPHYSDRPSRSLNSYAEYKNLTGLYKKLFGMAEDMNVVLAGIVEDSRSTAFCSIIKNEMLPKLEGKTTGNAADILDRTRDTNILFLLLKRGERSMVFNYSKNPDEHRILKDFPEHSRKIQSFYLKTARWDRPIRVDFLSRENPESEADRIGSVLLSVSGQHSGYGIPAPIIVADSIAKLSGSEMDSFYSQVIRFAGNIPSAMQLRRELRPF